jgi:thymidylate synthase (FAD)
VLEHAQFTFFITGVSRGLTHELVRHRVGVAISQRSTRYVDEDESPWILHPLLEQYTQAVGSGLADDWKGAIMHCRAVYRQTVERLQKFLSTAEPTSSPLESRRAERRAASSATRSRRS